ncbi:MAG: methyltransferase [Phycisphaerae bacterium]|nr:methyltransferase [Phycisphaerae bacterium]
MKNLPQVDLDFDHLTRILYGAIPARLLLTAIELKVFSHLTEPMSADSVASKIQSHPGSTRPFLDALAANELLSKRQGRYQNTPLADAFLVEGRPTYLGDVFRNLTEYMRPALESMTTLVREGQAPPRGFSDPSLEERETEIYANYQRAGRAQQAAAMVSKLPEFPQMTKMLDLGAGAGLIGLAIVAAHPTMTGVLFDRPDVVEVARQFISEYEMEGRVATIGGDYSTDAIGDGYDLVWTSYTLNFHRGDLDPIMRKIHAALNPGGVYASLAEGLSHERTKPATLVNAMLAHSLAGDDLTFDVGEIAQAMLRAGFRSVHSRQVEGGCWHGPAVVDIGRK